MIITGDMRPETEFRLQVKPENMQAASFIALGADEVVVSRRLTDLFRLPDDCVVLANWHGERRTDVFRTTVGYLKKLAAGYGA